MHGGICEVSLAPGDAGVNNASPPVIPLNPHYLTSILAPQRIAA
jgi:hypothetical protein